jgi:hypothetical protein
MASMAACSSELSARLFWTPTASSMRRSLLARSPVSVRSGPHGIAGFGRDDKLIAVRIQILVQNPPEVFFGRSGGGGP